VSAERFVCIHGHFYQPPRESPWTEEIEDQPSARPYRNWNERITAECYGPLADRGVYARMSFDFGPTLLHWMERKKPPLYGAILQADRDSRGRFSGHGSAMAQPYNHMILPLANRRDRVTQVVWGIRDFEWRFGRKPVGMWLPETAVDLETLEILASQGIRFTVLAPHQARAEIDPRRAYGLKLSSGRRMQIFFYDGAISRSVAFEGLASAGNRLADRLLGAFSPGSPGPQLVHIASDGETYGHHHAGGDRALDEALRQVEHAVGVRLTNYEEYLERHPPAQEVEIVEKSSWSCPHGIDRWWSDCGCHSGAHPGWSQSWRTPLRDALDWLRDTTAPLYEREAAPLLKDPWAARDRSMDLVLDPSSGTRSKFMQEQGARPLSGEDQDRVLKLLDLQRQLLLMYTSCGWFFDDIGGPEAVQILRCAARAIEWAEGLFAVPLEPRFLGFLERAQSNDPEKGDGRRIYETAARPAKGERR